MTSKAMPPTVGRPATLDELARSYLDAARPSSKPSTLQSKADLLRLHILPALGERPAEAIDDATIASLTQRKLAEGAQPKTVNNILSCLRCVLVFGAERGLVAELPRFVWPCGRRTEAQPQTQRSDDDTKRLVDAAEPGWRAMIALALAGLRLGELLGLRWADVDLAKRRVAIRRTLVRGIAGPPERGRPRWIALDEQAVTALRAHRHDRGRQVFCDDYCAPLTPEQTHWPLWRACDRAGLPRVGWDALRRRRASGGPQSTD
ncbi:MAG: site-specific integrase [Polyangiaceae bacterium]|jgi:integrase|nr:site-specific integrase [Polyangiaceae bacterium]